MTNDSAFPEFSRRDLLKASASVAGIASATPLMSQEARAQSATPHNARDAARNEQGGSNPGPENASIQAQNADSWTPPVTDHGLTPGFKYPFSVAHARRQAGGWSREVTVRDFPISQTMAGVNMRLTAGGVRELHWHIPAEWAYMLTGSARITGVDQNGRSSVVDVNKGDLWYFPSGIPHSIQGLEPDGCEFLLVFDDGAFSEFSTFQITDWMAHTPRSVLAKNFGVPESAFSPIPQHELYIFQAPLPGPLPADQGGAEKMGTVPEPFEFRMLAQPPTKRTAGGEVRIVDSTTFKLSKTIAAALVTLRPGGLRELHWHPRADEWQYYISGQGRMTIFAAASVARTMGFEAGDVGYVPRSNAHYVENTGDTDLIFLEMFRDSVYMDISLSEWMAHLPPELVEAHLKLPKSLIEAIPKDKQVVMPGERP